MTLTYFRAAEDTATAFATDSGHNSSHSNNLSEDSGGNNGHNGNNGNNGNSGDDYDNSDNSGGYEIYDNSSNNNNGNSNDDHPSIYSSGGKGSGDAGIRGGEGGEEDIPVNSNNDSHDNNNNYNNSDLTLDDEYTGERTDHYAAVSTDINDNYKYGQERTCDNASRTDCTDRGKDEREEEDGEGGSVRGGRRDGGGHAVSQGEGLAI